jgi:DNA-binding transcriptional ArsR family regulator
LGDAPAPSARIGHRRRRASGIGIGHRASSGVPSGVRIRDFGDQRCGWFRTLADRGGVRYTLNRMVQYSQARLDGSFGALSDATRRGVLEQLGRADASITDLAEKFHMTLTGMKKHVGVLEQAGLVTTEKIGRVRTCKLGPRRLEEEAAWLERYRELWDSRFDALEQLVQELKRKERGDGRSKK